MEGIVWGGGGGGAKEKVGAPGLKENDGAFTLNRDGGGGGGAGGATSSSQLSAICEAAKIYKIIKRICCLSVHEIHSTLNSWKKAANEGGQL
jgi:hypothetical protein